MNDLSWLLYAADAFPNIATAVTDVSGFAAIPMTIFSVMGVTRFFGKADEVVTKDNEYLGYKKGDVKDPNLAIKAAQYAKFMRPAIGAWLCFLASFLVPSQETFYAIAASEMGEEVVKSETAGKAMKALNAWLDRQIAPEKPAS